MDENVIERNAPVGLFEVRLAEAFSVFSCPPDWEAELKLIFPHLRRLKITVADAHCSLRAYTSGGATYSVVEEKDTDVFDVSRDDAILRLASSITCNIAERTYRGVALHAGCVASSGRAILLAGPSGAGKSTITAWFVDNGFDFHGDELVVLGVPAKRLTSFPRALVLRAASQSLLGDMRVTARYKSVQISDDIIINPPRKNDGEASFPPLCKVVLFPEYVPNGGLSVTLLSPAKACKMLMQHNVNSGNLEDGGLGAVAELTREVLAIDLRYGNFEQLSEVIHVLKTYVLDKEVAREEIRTHLGTFAPSAKVRTEPDPQPQPRAFPALLRRPTKATIGMATFDDYDGVYFTLQALRMYHGDLLDDVELIVVDNNPNGKCAAALQKLGDDVPAYRYVPQANLRGTAISKQRIFTEASGEFVICMDCHVLLMPGALRGLFEYFDCNPATRDLLQGPLLTDSLDGMYTHFQPEWRGGMFGTWDCDDRAANPSAAPFEIPMQGLGLFACRKDAWPSFNPLFRGFGGEEGYLHEKFRQAGERVLCLPFLRWVHRFNRPMGLPYPNIWEDRIWNYLVGFTEIGWQTSEIESHFAELLGQRRADDIFKSLRLELAKVV